MLAYHNPTNSMPFYGRLCFHSHILSLHSRPPIYTTMNLNLINLDCQHWTRDDWREAYANYCKTNQFGAKTKKEYYDMVCANHARLSEKNTPCPPELLQKWSAGRRAATEWAKRHGCDLNGRLLANSPARERTTREIAEHAEYIACDSMQKLDIILQRMHRK